MKTLYILLIFISLKAAAAATPSRIYFFDGFFVPVPITSELRAHWAIEKYLKENKSTAEFIVTHSIQWKSVCEDLNALKEEDRPEKLIFIGHSLGVGGAVEASRCLKFPVDFLLTIDGESLGVFPNDEVIPDNVRVNHNFYQTLDLFVKGNKNNHHPDGSMAGIENIFIDVPLSISPHIQIVDELFEQNLIFGRLNEVLVIP